jgi:hypothetical protein
MEWIYHSTLLAVFRIVFLSLPERRNLSLASVLEAHPIPPWNQPDTPEFQRRMPIPHHASNVQDSSFLYAGTICRHASLAGSYYPTGSFQSNAASFWYFLQVAFCYPSICMGCGTQSQLN